MAGGEPGADKTAAGLPVHKEEVDIVIPGVSQEKKLIWLSDLHIAGESKESDPEKKEDIAQRILYSSGSSGMGCPRKSRSSWPRSPDTTREAVWAIPKPLTVGCPSLPRR